MRNPELNDEQNEDRPAEPYERRRRVSDHDGHDRRAESPRPSRSRAWREKLNRWREPIIGLTMVGAAAPLLDDARSGNKPASPQARAGEQGRTDPVPAGTAEEQVGERMRASEEQNHRELTIAGAIARYDITADLASDIYDIAVEEDIEPDLAYGLVKTESTFRERVTSYAGARGLTQVLPSTANWLMGRQVDLFDRQDNLRTGFRYLKKLIADYNGDVRLALLAYNRGPGTVDRILRRGGNPDNGYARKVLDG
ncbi:MAG: lytic transglycosylase domain-containing protein [Longimicrobiales bacterium]